MLNFEKQNNKIIHNLHPKINNLTSNCYKVDNLIDCLKISVQYVRKKINTSCFVVDFFSRVQFFFD